MVQALGVRSRRNRLHGGGPQNGRSLNDRPARTPGTDTTDTTRPTGTAPAGTAGATTTTTRPTPTMARPTPAQATGTPGRKAALSGSVATKSLAISEALVWMAQINAAWIAFTLLGGVVFGFAPATVAASALCRRRLRGIAAEGIAAPEGVAAEDDAAYDSVGFVRAFWRAYRAEFWRANIVLLPVAVVCVLVASTMGFAVSGAPGLLVVLVGAVALVCAGVVAFLPTMYVHYELPTLRYASTASRFVLANPGPALLLLLTAGGITLLTILLPALLVFFSIGAWIQASTALCLSFFASNDERMSALADRSSN